MNLDELWLEIMSLEHSHCYEISYEEEHGDFISISYDGSEE